jgi:tol-pal system protein YbgF
MPMPHTPISHPHCRRPLFLGGLLLAFALCWQPIEAANREQQQMMADMRMLQEQNQQLQLALVTLTESIKALNARLDEQASAARKVSADQKVVVDTLAGDVRVVKEKLDDTNVRISRMSQEIEALRTAIPQMVAPPSVDTDPAATTPVEGAQLPSTTPATSTAGLSPQKLYDTAYADYTSGQWKLAVTGFETFIKSFPRSELADDAQYYIAETLSLDGRDEEAISAYDRLLANYPGGDFVPKGYYKRGLVFERLGQRDRAKESWEALVAKFPDSDDARMAKQKLMLLSRGR